MCLVRLDKDRPALIISTDALNRHALDVCVVPITSIEHRKFSLRVPLQPGEAGLKRASWAKCDQVTTLEKNLVRYPPLGPVRCNIVPDRGRHKNSSGTAVKRPCSYGA